MEKSPQISGERNWEGGGGLHHNTEGCILGAVHSFLRKESPPGVGPTARGVSLATLEQTLQGLGSCLRLGGKRC